MGLRSRRADQRILNRVLACVVVCGVGIVAGWVAGFSADSVQTAELSTTGPSTSEPTPAQIVAMRFQPDSRPLAPSAAPAVSSGYALASVVDAAPPAVARQMFSPYPTYASLSGTSLSGQTIDDGSSAPQQALAYAPADATGAIAPTTSPDRAAAPSPAPAAKRVAPPPHPVSASNTVLNNAQIASIHERLRLSSYQQQLWPPVESALRDIVYRQAHNDASRKSTYRGEKEPAEIDTGSPEVQRLKSVAIPLIMSMNEDQKQEVRTMARLMGLEQLASSF